MQGALRPVEVIRSGSVAIGIIIVMIGYDNGIFDRLNLMDCLSVILLCFIILLVGIKARGDDDQEKTSLKKK